MFPVLLYTIQHKISSLFLEMFPISKKLYIFSFERRNGPLWVSIYKICTGLRDAIKFYRHHTGYRYKLTHYFAFERQTKKGLEYKIPSLYLFKKPKSILVLYST